MIKTKLPLPKIWTAALSKLSVANLSVSYFSVLILVFGPFNHGLADTNPDPVATKKEIRQVQKRIEQLQNQIKRNQSQRSQAEQALRNAERSVSKIRRELRQANQNFQATESKLKALRKTQSDLNRAKQKQKHALKNDINAAYRAGRQEYVKLLLNQEQPDKMARVVKYYDYYHRARMNRIDEFNGTLAQISSNEAAINKEIEQLDQLKKRLQNRQDKLSQAKQSRQQALAKLDSDIKANRSKVGQLKSDQAELEKVLHAVQQTMSDLPSNMGKQPFAKRKGQLLWPSPGKHLKRFGNRRGNGSMNWKGILIQSQLGSEVKSIHPGRVVFSDWLRGFGMLTIIDHGDGYMSLYGHNESLLKSPGDWVASGEVIAFSGNQGGQSPEGLYFEIRKDGKPVNPASWCRG